MNTVSGRIVLHDTCLDDRLSPRRVVIVTQSPSTMPMPLGEARVHLHPRLWILLDQRPDASRLRARQVHV